MKFINLTPHKVCLPNGTQIDPSGFVARANLQSKQLYDWDGISFFQSELKSISNVPEPKSGNLYIVPVIVRVNMPDRADLVSPTRLIKNQKGEVVGCGAFEVNKGFSIETEWSPKR